MTFQTVKIAPQPPAPATSDANVTAIPAGAIVLASSGMMPTVANGLAFFTPSVPVHLDQSGQVYFYVGEVWLRPDGTTGE
jgi:hypothetical protein